MSAHPKVDAKTGELCVFGYNMMNMMKPGSILDQTGKGCVHYSLFDGKR